MTSSHLHSLPPVDITPQSEQIEDLLRFVRSLDSHSDPDRLLRSLPAELSSIVVSNTTALIHMNGDGLSCYAVDGKRSAIGVGLEMPKWQGEVCQFLADYPQPVV